MKRLLISIACVVVVACTPEGRTVDVLLPPGAVPADDTVRRLRGGVVYRRFCPHRNGPRGDLLARYDGSGVVVVSRRGDEIARIRGKPPIGWSASGALLAVGPRGTLWTWDGNRYENPSVPLELTSGHGATWAWSPHGDCALVLDGGTLVAFHTGAGANSTTVVPDDVEGAAWGPRGLVAVVLDEGGDLSLWIADLKRSRMRRVSDLDRAPRVVLGGWTRTGDILYWTKPGRSDSWSLHSVDERGRTRTRRRGELAVGKPRVASDSTATPPTGLLTPAARGTR